MEENTAREQIVETGVMLLDEDLVVRTWGNLSSRLDAEHFLITPSGMDYRTMKAEDLPIYHIPTGEWTGTHKPSSEKGIHASAYELFPEAEFVIHTHQTYASAIAVYGIGEMDISAEEHRSLGGLAMAAYGLPGTKALKNAVREVMKAGAHTILMQNHGVVIVGSSREEAIERARLLESICRRNCLGLANAPGNTGSRKLDKEANLMAYVRRSFPYAECVKTDAVYLQAKEQKVIHAQLDDMAQMIGSHVPVVTEIKDLMRALKHYHAALIPGLGGVVAGEDADDTEALASLLNKAAIAARHTQACGVHRRLHAADTALMHLVYVQKYAGKKNKR